MALAHEDIAAGHSSGRVWVYRFDLANEDATVLAEIPPIDFAAYPWAFVWTSFSVTALDKILVFDLSNPVQITLLVIDIHNGEIIKTKLPENMRFLYYSMVDASGRYIYNPVKTEKGHLEYEMNPHDFRALMTSDPGKQDLLKIDIYTGELEPLFLLAIFSYPIRRRIQPSLSFLCVVTTALEQIRKNIHH